jgi:hypothetical protein
MAGNELNKPGDRPDTWPAVVSRALELASESWTKLIRVIILVAVLGVVAWVIVTASR